MRTIEELVHDTYYEVGHSQLIVDFVSEVEVIFNEDIDDNVTDFNPIIADLEVLTYNISNILEIINPQRIMDIEALKDLQTIVEIRLSYLNSLEFRN